jgi:ribosomal protein S12
MRKIIKELLRSLEILIKKIIRIQLCNLLSVIAYLFSCGTGTSLTPVDYTHVLYLRIMRSKDTVYVV